MWCATCFDSILVRLKGGTDPPSALAFANRFRFHTGSIKSSLNHPIITVSKRFDSILVRLKVEFQTGYPLKVEFRFHTGSIKSEYLFPWGQGLTEFRFHTGSIKRSRVYRYPIFPSTGFDSILVRLKDWKPIEMYSAASCFDSILVRLKARKTSKSRPSISCFDSILVRLKAAKTPQFQMIASVSIPYWFD